MHCLKNKSMLYVFKKKNSTFIYLDLLNQTKTAQINELFDFYLHLMNYTIFFKLYLL